MEQEKTFAEFTKEELIEMEKATMELSPEEIAILIETDD